jgi:hypothetical protein
VAAPMILAKQASATESPRVLRSSKSFSLNVSPTKIPLRSRGYTNAGKCPDCAHRNCVEKLNIRQLTRRAVKPRTSGRGYKAMFLFPSG